MRLLLLPALVGWEIFFNYAMQKLRGCLRRVIYYMIRLFFISPAKYHCWLTSIISPKSGACQRRLQGLWRSSLFVTRLDHCCWYSFGPVANPVCVAERALAFFSGMPHFTYVEVPTHKLNFFIGWIKSTLGCHTRRRLASERSWESQPQSQKLYGLKRLSIWPQAVTSTAVTKVNEAQYQ